MASAVSIDYLQVCRYCEYFNRASLVQFGSAGLSEPAVIRRSRRESSLDAAPKPTYEFIEDV
jgi:hypothetical protein